jgi:transposase
MAMSRLASAVDGVIGVDPHRDTLAAAATDVVGGLLAQTSVSADAAGYRRLLDFALAQVPGRRCWAVEGAGSYGAGLAALLQAHGEWVGEVGRPKRRPPRRTGAKSDALDAVRAAREALTQDHPLAPRRRGDREALRVLLATRHSAYAAKVSATNQLKALIVGVPEELRAELRGLATRRQVARCGAAGSAGQIAGASHDGQGTSLDRAARPAAGRRGGRAAGRTGAAGGRSGAVAAGAARCWPISAAPFLVSWSYAGRLRSEAAFAALPAPTRSKRRDRSPGID